jgi:hypothetical protein
VRDLATGATMTFGNVTEYVWQPRDGGRLLAMVISADGQAGNGVQVFDTATSILRPLESSAADYSALVWRDDSSDLVVLKAKNDDKRDGPTQVVLAWSGVGTNAESLRTLDHTVGNLLPPTQRIVTFRRPSWLTGPSSAGPMLLIGVADWGIKPTPPENGRGANAGRGATPPANDKADVDVWHWQDTRVNPAQKLQVAADRRRNLPAVWHVATNKLVVIGKSFDENVTPIRNTTQALISEFTPYLDRSIGRGASDWFIADLMTGARTPLKANVAGNVAISTGGKYADLRRRRPLLDDRCRDEGRHEHHEEPQSIRRHGVRLHVTGEKRCSASLVGRKTMSRCCERQVRTSGRFRPRARRHPDHEGRGRAGASSHPESERSIRRSHRSQSARS